MKRDSFSTVAIMAFDTDPKVLGTVRALVDLLHQRKMSVWVSANTEYAEWDGVSSCPEQQLSENCDLLAAVGGDGTMLRAAHLIGRASVPLLGINRGRRGFLADIKPDQFEQDLGQILDGQYLRESRMMLTATSVNHEGESVHINALNDVVVQRGSTGQTLDFEVRVDDQYVNTHRGDGLIISTPTGSTAYALSSGGPIMQPGLNAVAMVPICPHTLSDRPVVIPGNSHIEIRIQPRFEAGAFVTVDGKMGGELSSLDTLHVTQSPDRVTLLHPRSYDYFEVLRSKLNWGHYGLPEKA